MKNETLYLVTEDQMSKFDEIVTELQSFFLDVYSNSGVHLGDHRRKLFHAKTTKGLENVYVNETRKP